MSKLASNEKLNGYIATYCSNADIADHARFKARNTLELFAMAYIKAGGKVEHLASPYEKSGKLKKGISAKSAHVKIWNQYWETCYQQIPADIRKLLALKDSYAGKKGKDGWKANIVNPEHVKAITNNQGYATSKMGKIKAAVQAYLDKQSKIKAGEATSTKKSELDRLMAELSKAFDRVKAKNDKLPESFGDERRRMIKVELEAILKDLADIQQA